jgi:O-antigen/teichoic acid export membrane protein
MGTRHDEDSTGEPHRGIELDHAVVRGSMWVAVGYGARNAASLLTVVVLAHFLSPADFGLVALAWTLLYAVSVLQEGGVGAALIYRPTYTRAAAASALAFSFMSGAVLYGAFYVAAPLLADVFRADDGTGVLRAMGVVIVLRSLSIVPEAVIEREFDFRSRAFGELAAAVVQLASSVGLAVGGAGVWSLVVGHLAGQATQTVLYWLLVSTRPDLREASLHTVRELLRYGRFVTGSNLLVLVNNTMDNLTVSRMLGPAALGIYGVSFRLADAPNTVIGYIVGRVMFPFYARLQHDVAELRRVYVQNLQRIALLALPVSVGLFISAEPIVLALLGDGWEEGVGVVRILAVYGLIKSFTAPAGEVFKGTGRPHWTMIISGAQLCAALPLLIVLVGAWEIEGAAVAVLAGMVFASGISFRVVTTIAQLSGGDLVKAVLPSVLCSAGLAAALSVLLVPAGSLAPGAALALLVGVGMAVYAGLTAVLARQVVAQLWASVRSPKALA